MCGDTSGSPTTLTKNLHPIDQAPVCFKLGLIPLCITFDLPLSVLKSLTSSQFIYKKKKKKFLYPISLRQMFLRRLFLQLGFSLNSGDGKVVVGQTISGPVSFGLNHTDKGSQPMCCCGCALPSLRSPPKYHPLFCSSTLQEWFFPMIFRELLCRKSR